MNKAIVVVGMHRSGTSAISGLLDELGVFMGKNLYGPQKGVNEKGFFENAEVVELNDRFFDALYQSWDDPFAYNFEGVYSDRYQPFEVSTTSLLESEYGGHGLWGMKDPRTSLHLPFWHRQISQKNIEPCYLMMLRNPLEVAMSLKKRDGFSIKKGLILWCNYTLSTYLFCRDKTLLIVDFNQLISEPKIVLKTLSKSFDITLPKNNATFIEKKLRNNDSGQKASDTLSKLALEIYQALGQRQVDSQLINRLVIKYEEYILSFDSLFKEQCLAIKKDEVYYRSSFLNAYRSYWWKFTWPIRKLEKIIRS